MLKNVNLGSALGQAVKWISEEYRITGEPIKTLRNKAIAKFDLSPMDGEFLIRNLNDIE